MKLKEKITKLFYVDKLKPSDIAKKLRVSKSTVTRYIKENYKYEEEKEKRKIENRNKKIAFTKKYMNEKRKKNNDDYLIIKKQHDQASIELSGGSLNINNRAFRRWNSSVYKYDKKSQSYKLDKKIIAGADVPKKIDWKGF